MIALVKKIWFLACIILLALQSCVESLVIYHSVDQNSRYLSGDSVWVDLGIRAPLFRKTKEVRFSHLVSSKSGSAVFDKSRVEIWKNGECFTGDSIKIVYPWSHNQSSILLVEQDSTSYFEIAAKTRFKKTDTITFVEKDFPHKGDWIRCQFVLKEMYDENGKYILHENRNEKIKCYFDGLKHEFAKDYPPVEYAQRLNERSDSVWVDYVYDYNEWGGGQIHLFRHYFKFHQPQTIIHKKDIDVYLNGKRLADKKFTLCLIDENKNIKREFDEAALKGEDCYAIRIKAKLNGNDKITIVERNFPNEGKTFTINYEYPNKRFQWAWPTVKYPVSSIHAGLPDKRIEQFLIIKNK